jgi:hypothetical protein
MDKAEGEVVFSEPGSISGTVTDGEGLPLGDIQIDVSKYSDPESFGRGAQTQQNGTYIVTMLPADDYRVFAFGGESGYNNEFYNDTTDFDLAVPVSVSASAETPGIDFELVQAGSISGTVFDSEGNTLANIAVDIEEGGYGTCTDEDGIYTMLGLPLGTYAAVAGRQFCDPHSFLEETVFGITLTSTIPDVGGVDFTLDPAP